jgi:hypothetical protein
VTRGDREHGGGPDDGRGRPDSAAPEQDPYDDEWLMSQDPEEIRAVADGMAALSGRLKELMAECDRLAQQGPGRDAAEMFALRRQVEVERGKVRRLRARMREATQPPLADTLAGIFDQHENALAEMSSAVYAEISRLTGGSLN